VPVIVTVAVPIAADALAVNVRVLVDAFRIRAEAAVTPLGRPEALRVTFPLNSVQRSDGDGAGSVVPCTMVRLLGAAPE